MVVETSGSTSSGLTFNLTSGVVWFVDADATGGGTGMDWPNAFATITAALIAATTSQEIWVAAGTYQANNAARTNYHQLISNTPLLGGFNATEGSNTQRDWKTNRSIINGDINGDDVGYSNAAENFCILVAAANNSTSDDGLALSGASPAVDSGTSAGMPSVDITGSPRPVGAGHDMGAYERQ